MDYFLEIYYDILIKILSSEISPGEKLSSTRVLSLKYNANKNTVQKALKKLEVEKVMF